MLKNLKILREEKGISQQKLADAIGTSQSSINDYENRSIEPDISTLIRLADYFETSIDFIVAHTNIKRRIEKVSDESLNDYEMALVKNYRQLADSSRKILNDLVVDILKYQVKK